MQNHPAFAVWLAAGSALLVLAVLHGWAVVKFATERPGEHAWTMKPRTYWLLMLTFLNPLMPFSALVVAAFVFKSVSDGEASKGRMDATT